MAKTVIMGGRARLRSLSAAAALAYLVAMVVTGAMPRQAQFVAFEAAGIMRTAPALVGAVTLAMDGHAYALERRAGAWVHDAQTLAPTLATHLDLAIKFLYTARPVRELPIADIDSDELAGLGFDAPTPGVSVTLPQGGTLLLDFGKPSADGELQYLRVQGRDVIYLMSRFVGEEWQAIADGLR